MYQDLTKTINVESKNGLLTFKFLNGEIALNETEYGAYAICPGCGSGKTTAIKKFMDLKWNEGILYAAFTRDEVNSMYEYIVNNLVGKSIIDGRLLQLEDIVVLHSDYEAKGTDKDLWINNPEEVANKRIVLCTHSKLLNEPLATLIGIKFPRPSAKSKKGRLLTGNDSNIRNWIIIDEGIDMRSVQATLSKDAMLALGRVTDSIRVTEKVNGGFRGVTKKLDRLVAIRNAIYYSDFEETVMTLAKVSPSFKSIIRPEVTRLDKLRNEQIIDELFDGYSDYMNNSLNTSDNIKISYGLSSWSMEGMKTHLLLLDGTSDVTLSMSRRFILLTYDNKYNSQVNINLIPFSLDRKIKLETGVTDYDLHIRTKLESYIDNLAAIINQNERTLIFSWLNFKVDNSEVNDEVTTGLIADSKEFLAINQNLNLPKYIETGLINRGISQDKFSVEYYGSGKDKATNQFRDYDSVVLFGRYHVPNSVISDFNVSYHTGISGVDYYANRVIQAICRSRIRLHNGLPINVYFSSDWSKDVIDYVVDYFKTGLSKTVVFGDIEVDKITEDLRSIGITPARAKKIAKLSTLDPGIYHAIMNGIIYRSELNLNEIFAVLPMNQKKSKEYNLIVNTLRGLGVELIIK